MIPRYDLKNLPTKKHNSQPIRNSAGTKELKAMNMLKQRRDYFKFVKLTVIFTAGFFRILEVLNLGIKSVKNT